MFNVPRMQGTRLSKSGNALCFYFLLVISLLIRINGWAVSDGPMCESDSSLKKLAMTNPQL